MWVKNESTPDSINQVAATSKALVYLGAGLSVANGTFNDYKVGNAKEFYQFLTGDPSLKLDDGAIGFKYFSLGVLGISSKGPVIGFELSYIAFHSTRAISGTNHSLVGTGADMHFGLKIVEMALRLGPKLDDKGSNISIEGAWEFGIMNGKIEQYGAGGGEWLQKGEFGMGYRAGLSMDLVLGKNFIANARIGYRSLKVEEGHKDPTSGKMVNFYANSDGDSLMVDWSGKYASVGLAFVMNSKGKKS